MNSTCMVCGQPIDPEAIKAGTRRTEANVAVVNPTQGSRQLHDDGKWYYFCGNDCRAQFINTPERYIEARL